MNAVRILCIETALSGCSVCLSENEKILAQSVSDATNSASDKLHTLVEEVFERSGKKFSDIHAVAVSNGPGSYTGLRIGGAAAKGYAFALQIPLIALSTLQVMAAAAKFRHGLSADAYLPAIDARRNEIFCALYDNDLNILIKDAPVILDDKTQNTFDSNQKIFLFGSGSQKLYSAIERPGISLFTEFEFCSEDMILLALRAYSTHCFSDPAYTEPNYTKDFYYPSAHSA